MAEPDRLSGIIDDGAKTLQGMMKDLVADTSGADVTTQMQRIGSMAKQLKQLASDTGVKLNDQTIDAVNNLYAESERRNAWMLDQNTPSNVAIRMDFIPQDQVQSMLSSTYHGSMFSPRIFEISDKVAQDIQDKLTQGVMLGKSVEDMASDVMDVWGSEHAGFGYRAMTIARTETVKAREYARDRMFKQNKDIIDKEVWVTLDSTGANGEDYPCEICTDVEEQHNEEGHTELQPVIDTHPNCVCTKMAEVKDWHDLLSDDNSNEEVPDEPEPFEDWKENAEAPEKEEEPANVMHYDEDRGIVFSDGTDMNVNMVKQLIDKATGEEVDEEGFARMIMKNTTEEELDGLPEIRSSNTSNPQTHNGKRITLTGRLGGVYVYDTQNFLDTYRAGSRDFTLLCGDMVSQEVTINATQAEDLQLTIDHEIAHHGFYDLLSDTQAGRDVQDDWMNFYKDNKLSAKYKPLEIFPSTYALKDPGELHAEAVAYYKADPAGFTKRYPDLAQMVTDYLNYLRR